MCIMIMCLFSSNNIFLLGNTIIFKQTNTSSKDDVGVLNSIFYILLFDLNQVTRGKIFKYIIFKKIDAENGLKALLSCPGNDCCYVT